MYTNEFDQFKLQLNTLSIVEQKQYINDYSTDLVLNNNLHLLQQIIKDEINKIDLGVKHISNKQCPIILFALFEIIAENYAYHIIDRDDAQDLDRIWSIINSLPLETFDWTIKNINDKTLLEIVNDNINNEKYWVFLEFKKLVFGIDS